MSDSSGKAHCYYMWALLISGPMYEDSLKNTIDALNHLADCGYKVSASKAQICTQAVTFLGLLLESGKRSLLGTTGKQLFKYSPLKQRYN